MSGGFSWRETDGDGRRSSMPGLRTFELNRVLVSNRSRTPHMQREYELRGVGSYTAGSLRLEEFDSYERAELVRSVTAEVLVERLPPVRVVDVQVDVES